MPADRLHPLSRVRRARHRHLLVASLLLVVTSATMHGGAWAAGDETTRTAPYDFGCLLTHDYVCADWETARQGTLHGGRAPMVTTTYSIPPFPRVTYADYSSVTGIDIDVTELSLIRLSAVVRRSDSIPSSPDRDVAACFGVRQPLLFRGIGCAPLSGPQPLELTTEFDGSVWARDGFHPGRWAFVVHLQGARENSLVAGPAEVQVESISYDLTPARVLSVSTAGSGTGFVRSSDGKIACESSGDGSCSRAYPPGTEVVLTATPVGASSFQDWVGCDRPEASRCTQVIGGSAETVTARFQSE